MASINWKVHDSQGNIVGHYSQTVAEMDVVTKYDNQQDASMYSNSAYSPSEVQGTTTDALLAPKVVDAQLEASNVVDFLPYISNSSLHMKRFVNPVDNTEDAIANKITYEEIHDLYVNANSYGPTDWHRFIASTPNYSMYIGAVYRDESIGIDINKDGNAETVYTYSMRVNVYDPELQNIIAYFKVSPPSFNRWYGNVNGYYWDLWFSLFFIHNFNPKYYSVGNDGYNNGKIKLEGSGSSSNVNEPFAVPFLFMFPRKGFINTLYQGSRVNVELEVYNTQFDLDDLIAKKIYSTDCLLREYTGTFSADFSQQVLNWRMANDTQETFDNEAMSSNVGGFQLYVPFRKVGADYSSGIVYETLAYEVNQSQNVGDPTSDIPTNQNGYNPGGTFTGYQDIDSETNDGLNGWSIQAMNANHGMNFVNYVGHSQVILDLVERLFSLDNAPEKMLFSLWEDWKPSDVIFRILEFPFDVGHLFATEDLIDAVPSTPQHHYPLCTDLQQVTPDVRKAIVSIVTSGLSDSLPQVASLLNNTYNLFCTPESTPHYYKASTKRYIEIPYGSIVLKRIFGNSLDYTDVNYFLNLPGGDIVKLDPNYIFRDSSGQKTSEGNIELKGILDIESGDVLITVQVNDNMITQVTINVASERSVYGRDEVQQFRNIANHVKDLALSVASATIPSSSSMQSAVRDKYVPSTIDMSKDGKYAIPSYKNLKPESKSASQSFSGGLFNILENSTFVIDPGLYAASTVEVTKGSISGNIKQIANQIPFIDVVIADTAIPSGWRESRGLTAATNIIGTGFNKFGIVDSIVEREGYMLPSEKDELSAILKGGFYK